MIVKYVFVVVNVDVDKSNTFLRNFDTKNNKRESFDVINFDIIVAQNICFLDIANNVANNINSLKLNVASKIKIIDEIKKV